MADVREISFAVPGGTAPLTWGQRAIWMGMSAQGEESHLFNLRYVLPVPPGRSVQDVADAVRALVQRHTGLVTRFPRYADDPYQDVAADGTIQLAVHAAAAEDAEQVATFLGEQAGGRCFQHQDELPVRFAVVLVDGEPRQFVMVASHLVVDVAAFRIVLEEFEQLLGGKALPSAEGTWSPLALAEHEQGATGRARSAAAMRYWRDEMLESPPAVFDVPMLRPEPARFLGFRLVSPAVAVAAGRLARSGRRTTSAVLLAAVAALLGHYTGHSRVPIQLMTANRWHPQVLRTIASMNELGTFSVTLADLSFDDLADLTWKRALTCYQSAAYDPLDLEVEMAAVQRQRGVHINRKVHYNDARRTDGWPQAPEIAATETALSDLRAATRVEPVGQWDLLGQKLCVTVLNTADQATVDLEVDTAFMPARTARKLLTGMESLLVRAAFHPVRLDQIGALTGIAPVVRGSGWARVAGAGWVDLAASANLVAAVPDVARCALFPEPAGPPAGAVRLVAYLVASRPQVTPEAVHGHLCSLLGERTDVMAPQHYVLCAAPPPDDSHAGWRSQPVLISGSGR